VACVDVLQLTHGAVATVSDGLFSFIEVDTQACLK